MCGGPSACTQKTPNLRFCFFKRRLTNTPRRHRLADDQLSSLYAPSPRFSSFGAASVVLCCSAPPASLSAPLRPSVRYPTTGLVVNTMHIRTFCDHINVLHIFGQICIVLKSGWSSTTTRMLASWLVFLCLRLTPRRHRQADGQPSPFYPPSPSFKSFGAACVKLCCLPPPSLAKNIHICSLV